MQLIKRSVLLWGMSLLGGCGGEVDDSFCASHGSEHRQHRDQQAQLVITYAANGDMAVQLGLPGELAVLPLQQPADILTLPGQCTVGAMQRSQEPGALVLGFTAHCQKMQPESLSVALLDEHPQLQEIEVTMTTPAVRKHFVVHRDCERAMFNIDGDASSE